MILLIDCGNSSIKLAISDGSFIDEVHSMDYINLSKFKSNLKKKINALNKINSIEKVYIVSVKKEVNNLLKTILNSGLKNIPIKFLNKRSFKNFKSTYKKPANLGIDRFFNCIGGNFLYPRSNLIIVDMGTATTIDVITKKLNHLGGIILPGALSAHYSLIKNTSMIKEEKVILNKTLLGQSTIECLSSGFVNGQFKMIDGLVQEIISSSNLRFKILITGGISNIFLDSFKNYEYHPTLVLNGILNYIIKD